MKCSHCKIGELIYVPQDLPYYEEHFICSRCDSTYNNLEENMKEKEFEKFAIDFIEDWIRKEFFPPTVKELKKMFPDLMDFEIEYLIKEAERRAEIC